MEIFRKTSKAHLTESDIAAVGFVLERRARPLGQELGHLRLVDEVGAGRRLTRYGTRWRTGAVAQLSESRRDTASEQ
jgi:hypothetical protein